MRRNDSGNNGRESILSAFLSNISLTTWLIIINVILFLLTTVLFAIFGEVVYTYLALYPQNILQGKYLWTLITNMFLHGSIFHLFINMFVLYSLGRLCEKIIGRKRFLWFYIMSGIFAGLLSVLLAGYLGIGEGIFARIFGTPYVYMVGASGAIFAVAGLFVILLPNIRFSIIFLPFFSLPGYIMIPLALFATWIISVMFNLSIGNVAHFGGFIAGIIYGGYLRTKYKRKVRMLQKFFR